MSRVEVSNLSFGFGPNTVLHSLDLAVEDGEFLVLLGPSGCGKSTLLNCIAGLLDVSAGQVFIDNKNVTWDEPKDRGIGMVFQSYALYPQMSVEKNLSFSLRVSGMSKKEIRERVERVADLLQIKPLLNRKPAALSGGQKQRVAIGRAMVRDVQVFLLDEPLSNLDAYLRTDLRVELKRLHQRLKSTMIYVTHDQTEALTLADRIAVMKDGVIQQLDVPNQIYRRPVNRFVAEFVGTPRMNFMKGTMRQADGVWSLDIGNTQLPLADYEFMQTPAEGQIVELGVRPENISLKSLADNQSINMQMVIDVIEPTGADTLLLAKHDEKDFTIRVGSDTQVQVGDKVDISFSADKVSLFDANGHRI